MPRLMGRKQRGRRRRRRTLGPRPHAALLGLGIGVPCAAERPTIHSSTSTGLGISNSRSFLRDFASVHATYGTLALARTTLIHGLRWRADVGCGLDAICGCTYLACLVTGPNRRLTSSAAVMQL